MDFKPPLLLPSVGNGGIDTNYIAKYMEMMILTMILGQLPNLGNTILVALIDLFKAVLKALQFMLLESWTKVSRSKTEKFRYSKLYKYDCDTEYYSSHRSQSTRSTNSQISSFETLSDLLDYIVNINFSKISSLDNITYNYILLTNTHFRLPIINEAIQVEPGLYMHWSVSITKREIAENKEKKDEEAEPYHIGQSSIQIKIATYTNTNKELLENFEEELKRKRQQSVVKLDSHRTISYYYHKMNENNRNIAYTNRCWDTYKFRTTKTFDNIFLPEKSKILHMLQTFCHDKPKYCRLGKQYYLGILLYGLPGCGKTSLIKAIADYTNRNIYVVKLSEIHSDDELKDIFQQENIYVNSSIPGVKSTLYCRPFDKRIIVIEDIDLDIKLIEDRKTKLEELENLNSITQKINDRILNLLSDKDAMDTDALKTLMKSLEDAKGDRNLTEFRNEYAAKFNLDVFLNLLDGIQEQDGTIFIMTSNFPENIDKALIRPGRCDLRIKFELSDRTILEEMIRYYYGETIDTQLLNILDRKFTASEFCQILYENDYESFQKWLQKVNGEDGFLDTQLTWLHEGAKTNNSDSKLQPPIHLSQGSTNDIENEAKTSKKRRRVTVPKLDLHTDPNICPLQNEPSPE